MPLYEPTVPARYTALIIDYVRSMHADRLAAILDEAQLDEGALRAPHAAFTLAQCDALLRAIAGQTGRADIGFELGRRISIDAHGALAPALRRCATLDEALRLLARYFCLITSSFFVQYRRDAQHGELVYRPAAMMSPETLHDFYEIHAVSSYMQLKMGLQQRLRSYDVYVSMDAPRHLERYRELQPARFHFGPLPFPEVRLVFEAAQLDRAMVFADRQIEQAVEQEEDLSEVRKDIRSAHGWGDWVVLMLREADGCQPTLGDLAGLLNIGERTLTRYLAREGKNFRELSLQVRHQRACDLLGNPQIPITQISYRLGFNEPTNFSRAFRQACGVDPREYRHALMSKGRSEAHPIANLF